jgi:hypothetical protein
MIAWRAADVDRLRPIVHHDDTAGRVAQDRPRSNNFNTGGHAACNLFLATGASGGSNLLYLLTCLHNRVALAPLLPAPPQEPRRALPRTLLNVI